jgi:hypothetical protein
VSSSSPVLRSKSTASAEVRSREPLVRSKTWYLRVLGGPGQQDSLTG